MKHDEQDKPRKKKPYSPPVVVLSEELEAVAATCDPANHSYGKSHPPADPDAINAVCVIGLGS